MLISPWIELSTYTKIEIHQYIIASFIFFRTKSRVLYNYYWIQLLECYYRDYNTAALTRPVQLTLTALSCFGMQRLTNWIWRQNNEDHDNWRGENMTAHTQLERISRFSAGSDVKRITHTHTQTHTYNKYILGTTCSHHHGPGRGHRRGEKGEVTLLRERYNCVYKCFRLIGQSGSRSAVVVVVYIYTV